MKIQIFALILVFSLCMIGCRSEDINVSVISANGCTRTTTTTTGKNTLTTDDVSVITEHTSSSAVDISKIVTSSQVDGYSMTADAQEYSFSNKDIISLTIAGTVKEDFYFVDKPVIERLDGDKWVPFDYYDMPGNRVWVLVTPDPKSPCMTTRLFVDSFREQVKTGLYKITMTIMERPVSVIIMLTE